MTNAISGVKQNNIPILPSSINSPMEVIDILGALNVEGKLVITDDNALLNPKLKAEQVIKFFKDNFNANPGDLPQLAAIIKGDIKSGKVKLGGLV